MSFEAIFKNIKCGFKNSEKVSSLLKHPSSPFIASVNGNILLQARISGLHTVYGFKPWYHTQGMTHVDNLSNPLESYSPLSLESFKSASINYVFDSEFMSNGDKVGLTRLCSFLSSLAPQS